MTPSSRASRRPRPRAPCGSGCRARSSARRGRGFAAGARARARGRAALHPARVAADLAVGRLVETDAVEQLGCARLAVVREIPAASPAGGGGRGRSASGRARPPGARRRSRCAPSALRRRRRSRRPAPSRPSAAAASSASARSSTCRRRSGRGSRRSRRVDAEVDPVDRPRPLLELADETLDLDAVRPLHRHAPPYRRAKELVFQKQLRRPAAPLAQAVPPGRGLCYRTRSSGGRRRAGHEPDDPERRQRDLGRLLLLVPGVFSLSIPSPLPTSPPP